MTSSPTSAVFTVDAVLFDMDGTLTDSIAAVEAAWGKVATDLGLDPAYVIAATHGKRAIDNLAHFRPEIKDHEMDAEVAKFEQTILDFADAYTKSKEASRRESPDDSRTGSSSNSGTSTPALSASSASSASRGSSGYSSRTGSLSTPNRPSFGRDAARRPSFATRLNNLLAMSTLTEGEDTSVFEDEQRQALAKESAQKNTIHDVEAAWEIEADGVDRSIHILPGVREMIDCLPDGRYAVATSGAKTYAYGAMTRVGITPPPVTITADDKRLKAGKPAPDPFLLAAKCLGFPANKCVVFEDSPSGIRAGVASGATVIAVCTSHERSKIENCGAHFIVEDMRSVRCTPVHENGSTKLRFQVGVSS